MAERQGQGKIHRLPFETRMQLHAHLLDGKPQAAVLSWVNGLPEWLEIRPQFEGADITPQNLSDYKNGKEYSAWAGRQERISDLRTLANFARGMGEATAGTLTDGAADIASGKILERLECLISMDGDTEEIDALIETLVKLRSGDHKRQDLVEKRLIREQKDKLLAQKKQELDLQRDKLEIQAAESMLELARSPEVQALLNGSGTRSFKVQELRKKIFPQRKEADAS